MIDPRQGGGRVPDSIPARARRIVAASCAVAAALGIALALPGCEKEPEADARFVSVASIKTLDPVESGDMYSGGAQHQIYEGLLEYHYLKRPAELQPAIAEALPEISEDGTVYTFRLRKGIVFHDSPCFPGGKGREVTAQDFIYCWKRLQAMPDSQGSWLLEGKVKGLDEWAEKAKQLLRPLKDKINDHYPFEHPSMREVIAEEVEGLRALDDHTLRVELIEPYPQFLWTLAMNYTVVYAREALERHGMEFRRHPVGSGPYTVDEYWPFDLKILYVRNPTYRECYYPSEGEPGDAEQGLLADAGKRLPLLDRIEFHVITQSQPRWLRFIRGDLDRVETEKDLWEEVMTKDGQLRKDLEAQGIRIETQPLADIAYVAFNMEDPVIGTPGGERARKVRQAISLAYDTERWIDVMRNGFWGIPARGPIPPTVVGYVEEFSPYSERDVARAQALLEEAGYPGGRGLPRLSYEMTGTDAVSRHGSEIFKDCLAQIGIEVDLNSQTWGKFTEKIRMKQAQVFGMAWSADYPDAQNFLQLFYGPHQSPGPNNSNYDNEEFNRLYDQMKVMLPSPERDEIIRRMLRLVYEDAPWSFTDHRVRYSYFHHWFRNYKYNDLESWAFKYYDVDKEAKRRWLAGERAQ